MYEGIPSKRAMRKKTHAKIYVALFSISTNKTFFNIKPVSRPGCVDHLVLFNNMDQF